MGDLLQALKERSYRRGTFRLASGRESDFFIDCKSTVLRADGHVLAGRELLEAVRALPQRVEAVAGVALGGCSLASAVSLTSALDEGESLDAIYVRKTAKDHGTGKAVEGAEHLRAGSSIVLLEDTVTTGGSSVRALTQLTEAGFSVVAVVAIVDRLEGAAAAFEAAGVPFKALYSREDFV